MTNACYRCTEEAADTVETRTEYALRFPDRHVEALLVRQGSGPAVPPWAADAGAVVVHRQVHIGPWTEPHQ
jgi:hypothetical protein